MKEKEGGGPKAFIPLSLNAMLPLYLEDAKKNKSWSCASDGYEALTLETPSVNDK